MPEYVAESCRQNNECIDRYQTYGFFCWLGGAIITSYFAFILREYKARLYASHDEIESARLEKKVEELEYLKTAHARAFLKENSKKSQLTEPLITPKAGKVTKFEFTKADNRRRPGGGTPRRTSKPKVLSSHSITASKTASPITQFEGNNKPKQDDFDV